MSLSQAYGAKPDYTILTIEQFRKDMELMGYNDKAIFENKVKVDDDLQLADLIATIKNLPQEENGPSNHIIVPPEVQP